MAELSPMMQQYLEIKNQHKDEILFYRIGDFYEMFFDDAVTASWELDAYPYRQAVRPCGARPHVRRALPQLRGAMSARLIAKGYKVAICEQVEDPALGQGAGQAGHHPGGHPRYGH